MTPRNGTDGARRDWALVGGAWLALVLALSVWLAMDRRPPAWDSARELERAVQCSEDLGAARSTAIVARRSWEAPIVPCAAGAVYRLYGSDVAAAHAIIFLALGLGMAATYLLARDLAGATAAVPAAWIFGAAPLVLHSALRFQADLPLAAIVAVALLVLSRTDRFTRTPMSIVAGLVWALGMLVAPAFALYVVGPAVWLLAVERSWRAVVNAALAVVLTAAGSLPWYGPRVLLPMPTAPEPLRSTASQYAAGFVQQLGLLAVVLLVVGLVVAILRGRGFAIAAFLVPLAIVALARSDRIHETLPLLPAAAVLAGMTVGALPGPVRAAGLVAVGLAGVVQVSAVAWGVPAAMALPVLHTPWIVESPPSGGDWRHREVLRTIAVDSGGRPVTVSVLSDHESFSADNVRYYARRDRLRLRVVSAWETEPIGIDYVITKSGDLGDRPTAEASRRAMAQLARDAALARVYPVVADFPLPDGSTASVRARRVTDGVSTSPETLARALEAAIGRQLGAVAREVDNLALRVEHDAEIVRGRVKRIELSTDSAVLADYQRPDGARLRVRRLALVADDVLVNPFTLEADGRAALLDVGRLRVARAEISGDDAQAFLGQVRSLRRTRIRLTTDAIYVTARQPGADVSALIRVVPAADRRVMLNAERASIGWIPLPASLVNWVVRDYDPVERLTSGLPFPVEIAPVVVTERALRIGD
jgi:Dolichyl-phosphate-mannose-protein mannosyltransferase